MTDLSEPKLKINHKGTTTLETERLLLRRVESGDAEFMYRNWARDPEVTTYMTWQPHTDIDASQFIIDDWINSYSKSDSYIWVIVPKSLGEPIGGISVVALDDDIGMVEIGYCIGKKWWSNGYTSEALKELIRFFFDQVGVNRIQAKHDPRNAFSGRVMMKCGLKYEGTMRQNNINNLGIVDSSIYAILKEDYMLDKERGFHASIGNLAIDCHDPEAACSFYEALTGWQKTIMYDNPALVAENGLIILFMGCDFTYVPPVWPEVDGLQQKQMHLDFQVDHLEEAVERALQLGASKPDSQYGGDHFITLLDPEGHPFCLCRH